MGRKMLEMETRVFTDMQVLRMRIDRLEAQTVVGVVAPMKPYLQGVRTATEVYPWQSMNGPVFPKGREWVLGRVVDTTGTAYDLYSWDGDQWNKKFANRGSGHRPDYALDVMEWRSIE